MRGELTMTFREKRGIGYCGLACVLCNIDDCRGCKERIAAGYDCLTGKCAVNMSISNCFNCLEYDVCHEEMPHAKRNRAFNRYAREFGEQALLERLQVNNDNGIAYHTPNEMSGDYDKLETDDEIYQLLRYGTNDPYAICPEFDTEHFKLRQVCMEDAEDLLCFYSNLSDWMFNGNAWFKSIFSSDYATVNEMHKCIRFWLNEYKNKFFIRLSVIDKKTGTAIGTIEIFDNLDKAKRGSALHIDLFAPYETRGYIAELLNLADKDFFQLFGFKYLIVYAVPNAGERIAALNSGGYTPFESESLKHYYLKRSSV